MYISKTHGARHRRPPFCMELSPCPNEVVHFISVCMHFCIIAYMHTSIYAYNANWGASTKNRSKTNRKSLRNRPQNGPKSVPNRSKIGPRSASEPTSLPTSILDRFGTVFGPFWTRSWRPLGGLSGVKLGSSWSKNRFLEVLDGVQKRTWCWIPFWTIFGRFWGDLGVQNRPKIGPESVSRAIMT